MPKKRLKKIQKIYYCLLCLLFLVGAVIIAGTFNVFINKKDNTDKPALKTPQEQYLKTFYNDLGRLRALTSDKQACTVVIFPVLEYNINDKAFEEELVQKKEVIRKEILDWFSQKNIYELYTISDIVMKKEILKKINSNLSLSKIKRIYFKEYIILT